MFAEAPQLRKHLTGAFSGVRCPYPELEESDHGKLLELSLDIGGLPNESLQYILPRILEDILDYGPGSVSDLEFESVLDMLNVLSVLPPGRTRLIEREKARFALFTPSQTVAVTEWLRTVREWDEQAVTVNLEDIDAALNYWTVK